jgi:uncharacterized repeat protein (TIGR01451 family)
MSPRHLPPIPHRLDRRGRPARAVISAALVATSALVVASGGSAAAIPGNPGVPSAPVELFHEDFENGLSDGTIGAFDGQVTVIDGYVRADGGAYNAAAAWKDPARCNGIVLSQNGPGHASCGSSPTLGSLADALGIYNVSTTPEFNHAVSAYTAAPAPGANLVELETVGPLTLPSPVTDRFLAFAVNVASVNCQASAASLNFFLLDGVSEISLSPTATNACASPFTMNGPHLLKTVSPSGSLLFSGSTLGFRVRNANGSSTGNDHAFDDFRILDVTPQLDKAFVPDTVAEGDSSTLTFTVTNTAELAAKNGWSFTDTLPAGMTVALGGISFTDCSNGSILNGSNGTPLPGDSVLKFAGDLLAGQQSCQLVIDVVGATAGTYVNGAGNLSSVVGLDLPNDATLTVAPVVGVSAVQPWSLGVAAVGLAGGGALVVRRRRAHTR